MTTVAGTDLGLCDAFLPGGDRCEGRLIVERQVGQLLEAECDRCGGVAARPVARVAPETEEREEQWWQR
jgi:hypothetical protein